MKGLISIQHKDNECFRWCLVRYLNTVNKSPAKITNVGKEFAKQLDFKAIKLPIHEKDYAEIEKQINVSINVFSGYRGVVIVTAAKLHSTKPELRFCAGSNPARSLSEFRDGEDLWQWFQLEIRQNVFRRSIIPQKQFIIIIIIITIIIKIKMKHHTVLCFKTNFWKT